jgi:DNA-binding beta-propeller fold protein YncE
MKNFWMVLCFLFTYIDAYAKNNNSFITDNKTTLISVNDGEAGAIVSGKGEPVKDSITVINLSPTTAPVIKTVYDKVPSTLFGAPHISILGNYVVVTNHNLRLDKNQNFVELRSEIIGDNQVTVIDKRTLEITDKIKLDSHPWLARVHPDKERVLIGLSDGWLTLRIDYNGKIISQKSSSSETSIISFDLSLDGESILAGVEDKSGKWLLSKFILNGDDTVTHIGNTSKNNFTIDKPFAPRFNPKDNTVLILNSGGTSDGVLDDVLIIDLAKNKVISSIPQVSDGLESLAIHPSGKFAVVAGLNAMPWSVTSHLIIISLAPEFEKVLYTIPVEALPEGIEFSKNGKKLYVGSTFANHISVYDVNGFDLIRNKFVLSTGEGHAALGISFD